MKRLPDAGSRTSGLLGKARLLLQGTQAGNASRDVGLLFMSGIAAQTFNLAAYPFLTAAYSPAEFGVFATITTAATMLGSIACLRLDMVIQIAPSAEERSIITTSLVLAVVLSLVTFLGALLAHDALFTAEEVAAGTASTPVEVAVMVALLFLQTGIMALGRQFCSKKTRYRRVALSQVVRALATVACQLAIVHFAPGFRGLVYGFLFGLIVSLSMLMPFRLAGEPQSATEDGLAGGLVQHVRVSLLLLRRYRGLMAADVVNVLISAGLQTLYPVSILHLYGASETGLFGLASRLSFIPVDVLAAAISMVFFQRFSSVLRGQRDAALSLFRNALITGLGIASAIAAVLAIVVGPFVNLLFDARWAGTAAIVIALTPTMIMRFFVGCVGVAPLALQRPRMVFWWNISQIAIFAGAVAAARLFSLGPGAFLWLSGLLLLGSAFVYVWLVYSAIENHDVPIATTP